MFNFKQWLVLVVCSLAILKAEGLLVNITFVRNAVAKGAGFGRSTSFCLRIHEAVRGDAFLQSMRAFFLGWRGDESDDGGMVTSPRFTRGGFSTRIKGAFFLGWRGDESDDGGMVTSPRFTRGGFSTRIKGHGNKSQIYQRRLLHQDKGATGVKDGEIANLKDEDKVDQLMLAH
ncbi:hypothetical protein HID58_029525 [Brassica napus]|uniref:Uncharacterized protein n=1 Tax=Brassica napus TaxID=3708 RepID=A0ABQ8CDD6_BRANA|nr:hypothetical protein HID58_029525 [Brassica napus]